jgi:hypothetical protein
MHNSELKAILASVCYLATESEKAGLNQVSGLFKRVVLDIDALMKNGGMGSGSGLGDADLHHTMEILGKVNAKNKSALREIIDSLELLESMRQRAH